MGKRDIVFVHLGKPYYYKEYNDGTFSVYPLSWITPISGMFCISTEILALEPRDIPPRKEWIIYPGYRLGWRRAYNYYTNVVEMDIVLYRWEWARRYGRNLIYSSLQDCMTYACERVLSSRSRKVIIHGVGTIRNCEGTIQIDRQPQSMWELVE